MFSITTEWLTSFQGSADFEHLEVDDLCGILRSFYGSVRTRYDDDDDFYGHYGIEMMMIRTGERYKSSSMVGIRASIQRHLSSPPYNRIINIISDKHFISANQVSLGWSEIN